MDTIHKNLTIGVDIGGTRTKYGLLNIATGEVVKSIVQPTEKTNGQYFLQQIGLVIKECKKIAAQKEVSINGIGFGIPGFAKEEGVVITTYGFLEFMENYPLKALVESEFELPCLMDNDARIVCLGEALYGKGKEYERVLTLTLGTGVGFGFVANKKITERLPLSHMGGHLKITHEVDDCYCGKGGCLESLVSSPGIIKLAQANGMASAKTVENVFEAALQQEEAAVKVMEKVIDYLHTAIHNYVNLFAPGIIVLGGGVAKGLLPYLKKIKGRLYMGPYPGYDFKLVVSELEEFAGMLGSAALFHFVKDKN